jgi:hypothetical protein
MTLYADKQGQFKAWRQPMARIKAMFHKVSVERKSTAIGTATNVPRNVPRSKTRHTLQPSVRSKRHIQTSVCITGIARMNMFA